MKTALINRVGTSQIERREQPERDFPLVASYLGMIRAYNSVKLFTFQY